MTYPLGVWQAMLATVYVADKVRQGQYDFVPTSRIATDLAVPASSLARLLNELRRAGVIETREGAQGGVRLAIPVEQVTLLDVVDAIEHQLPLFRTDASIQVTGDTPTRRQKALREALAAAEGAMRRTLEEVTIETISSS